VSPEKLLVLPQGINAAYFDPARHAPLALRALLFVLYLQGGVAAAGVSPYKLSVVSQDTDAAAVATAGKRLQLQACHQTSCLWCRKALMLRTLTQLDMNRWCCGSCQGHSW
jgi:hypothetical protein